MFEPSLGARLFVQLFEDIKTMFDQISEDDRADVIALIPELWSGDAEAVEAARQALYEIIDNHRGNLIRLL